MEPWEGAPVVQLVGILDGEVHGRGRAVAGGEDVDGAGHAASGPHQLELVEESDKSSAKVDNKHALVSQNVDPVRLDRDLVQAMFVIFSNRADLEEGATAHAEGDKDRLGKQRFGLYL